jgi:hypothetical protein
MTGPGDRSRRQEKLLERRHFVQAFGHRKPAP